MMPASRMVSNAAAHARQTTMLAAGLLLGACSAPSNLPSIAPLAPAEQASAAGPRNAGEPVDPAASAAANRANPEDPAAALAHARALRANNDKAEALAVLDRAAAAKPADRRLQLERGLLALELGDAAKGRETTAPGP